MCAEPLGEAQNPVTPSRSYLMSVIPFVNEYFAIAFQRNRIDVALFGRMYFVVWGSF